MSQTEIQPLSMKALRAVAFYLACKADARWQNEVGTRMDDCLVSTYPRIGIVVLEIRLHTQIFFLVLILAARSLILSLLFFLLFFFTWSYIIQTTVRTQYIVYIVLQKTCDVNFHAVHIIILNTLLFYVWTECTSPTLQPTEVCVPPGEQFTCMGGTGYPAPPSYTFTYWHESGMTSSAPPPYTVNQLGHFSLFCDATYRHHQCPDCYAKCFANFTGLVYGEYRA